MNEFFWNKLRILVEELTRLQTIRTDLVQRGLYSGDLDMQIDELSIRREHLARVLRTSVPPKVLAVPEFVGFEEDDESSRRD